MPVLQAGQSELVQAVLQEQVQVLAGRQEQVQMQVQAVRQELKPVLEQQLACLQGKPVSSARIRCAGVDLHLLCIPTRIVW